MFEGRGKCKKKKSKDLLKDHKIVLNIQSEDGEIENKAEYEVKILKEDFFSNRCIIIEDQTKIRELKEKIKAGKKQMNFLNELVSEAGHELKNPLSTIKGFIQVLEESLDEEDEKKDYINLINKELDRLNRLIKEIFTITRSKTEAPNKKEDLNSLIKEIIPTCLMYAKMSNKVIKIEEELSTKIPMIKVNQYQMKQVFLNLLNNAVDSIDDKGKIIIKTIRKKGKILVQIKDTGCGIEQEEISKIFDPFFTKKPQGTGLGLSIVNKIIKNHNGTIEVESEKGAGTTFTVKLPL